MFKSGGLRCPVSTHTPDGLGSHVCSPFPSDPFPHRLRHPSGHPAPGRGHTGSGMFPHVVCRAGMEPMVGSPPSTLRHGASIQALLVWWPQGCLLGGPDPTPKRVSKPAGGTLCIPSPSALRVLAGAGWSSAGICGFAGQHGSGTLPSLQTCRRAVPVGGHIGDSTSQLSRVLCSR